MDTVVHFGYIHEAFQSRELLGPADHFAMLSMVYMDLPGFTSDCYNSLKLYTRDGKNSSWFLLASTCNTKPLQPVVVMGNDIRLLLHIYHEVKGKFRLLFTFHKVQTLAGLALPTPVCVRVWSVCAGGWVWGLERVWEWA